MDISAYRSDIQTKIKEIKKLQVKSPEDAIKECEEILEYAQNQRDDFLVGFAHFTMGQTYYLINDIASFYYEMAKCRDPFKRIREWEYTAMSQNLQGKAAFNRGNVALALDQYYKALDLCEEYGFSDTEILIKINIADLLLSLDYLDDAMDLYDSCYKYVSSHMKMVDYVEILSKILLGKGKTLLKQEKTEEAWAIKNEIETKCLSFLTGSTKLAYHCFVVDLSFTTNDEALRSENIIKAKESFSTNVTVMDVFADVYVYLKLLLKCGDHTTFSEVYEEFHTQVKNTLIKNLEKKSLSVFIESLDIEKNAGEYYKACAEYYEACNKMETEDSLSTGAIIALKKNLSEKDKLIKEKERILQKERLKAHSDPLTALSNRLELKEYAEQAFERAIANEVGFAIELFDIDYFKEYREHYGHETAEKCMYDIAMAVNNLAVEHSGVSFYRYDGDVFAAVYQSFTEEEVFEMAKQLKNAVHEANIPHEASLGEETVVTVSQGLHWGIPKEGDSVWEYLHGADELLAKVKKKSRNSIMLGKAKHKEDPAAKIIFEPLISEPKEEEHVPAED